MLGAGSAGTNAATIAAGMGADVIILDLNIDRLRHLDELHWGRIKTVRSSVYSIDEFVPQSDLVIGAVLVAGAQRPRHRHRRPHQADEAGSGGRGHLHRPGRLHRDGARDLARRTDLLHARRRPLRRWQHPGGRAQHLHLRTEQRHPPVHGCAGGRVHRGSGPIPGTDPRSERRIWDTSPIVRWLRRSAPSTSTPSPLSPVEPGQRGFDFDPDRTLRPVSRAHHRKTAAPRTTSVMTIWYQVDHSYSPTDQLYKK